MNTFTLQSLVPQSARLCLEVEKFLLEQAAEAGITLTGKELVLAYSGGADSKALFFIMLALAPRLGCALALAHLDHALRPTSAAELDEAVRLAAAHGLPCYSRRMDVAALADTEKLGAETAGREARLRFFAELTDCASNDQSASGKADFWLDAGRSEIDSKVDRWILTGHQLNDLAEDILMRLLRGSGWPALGGMTAVNAQKRILRPLLLVSRQRLEDFLTSIGQDWLKDPMNEDQAYLRNRVRASILPLFLAENPSFLDRAADLWQLARLDVALDATLAADLDVALDATLAENLDVRPDATLAAGIAVAPDVSLHATIDAAQSAQPNSPDLILSKTKLRSLPKALRLRLCKAALERLGPGQPLLSNLMALDRAWEAGRGKARLQFPGGKLAVIEHGSIKFFARKG
ncbi:MAG: tRNA lysidine(34) synthetase TilS [Deltaproteobacteria bacterium]|jgi:tRNA(Ile)-lysidine synthase|nr:tRNA lysidine(34) synthetase TilS [Deltaproteobacteria bacterium]